MRTALSLGLHRVLPPLALLKPRGGLQKGHRRAVPTWAQEQRGEMTDAG